MKERQNIQVVVIDWDFSDIWKKVANFQSHYIVIRREKPLRRHGRSQMSDEEMKKACKIFTGMFYWDLWRSDLLVCVVVWFWSNFQIILSRKTDFGWEVLMCKRDGEKDRNWEGGHGFIDTAQLVLELGRSKVPKNAQLVKNSWWSPMVIRCVVWTLFSS